jgi:hypothetical protein
MKQKPCGRHNPCPPQGADHDPPTVLPFKRERTAEALTAEGGLTLVAEADTPCHCEVSTLGVLGARHCERSAAIRPAGSLRAAGEAICGSFSQSGRVLRTTRPVQMALPLLGGSGTRTLRAVGLLGAYRLHVGVARRPCHGGRSRLRRPLPLRQRAEGQALLLIVRQLLFPPCTQEQKSATDWPVVSVIARTRSLR